MTGFGGSGIPGTYTLPPDPQGTSKFYDPKTFVGCVQDGPFASYVVRLGPGKLITDHCLVRGVDDAYKQYLTSTEVAKVMNSPTFEQFRIDLEGRPVTMDHKIHTGGHNAVGGEMSNFYSSPAGSYKSSSDFVPQSLINFYKSPQTRSFTFTTPIWIEFGGTGSKCSTLASTRSLDARR